MSKKLYLIGAAIALYAQANAQISLVKNMQAGDILEIKQSGNQLFYTTPTPVNALWVSDGTTNGTIPVAAFSGPIKGLTAYNNKIYFIAPDTSGNLQLYGSDGTTANTKVVKKINPSGHSFDQDSNLYNPPSYSAGKSYYSEFTIRVMNGKMYFMASDGVHGRELWSSNGTDAGTMMVKDINPSPNAGNYPTLPYKNSFAVMNDKLYFYASDGGTQEGLWSSDGTAAGTNFVKRVAAYNLYGSGNKLFFAGICLDSTWATNGTYVTDGTDTGTHQILQQAFYDSRELAEYATLNNEVYFIAARDSNHVYSLYKTDGTAAGTVLLKDRFGGGPFENNYNRRPFSLTAFNNKVYFGLDNPWMTDGTVSGTQMLKDIGIEGSAYATRFTIAGNKLFFKAQDTVKADIWVSDGTDTGTHKITDSNSNYRHRQAILSFKSLQSPMIPFASSLYFSNFYDTTIATEFYKLDITPTSVNNLSTGVQTALLYPNPANQTIAVKGIKVQDFIITDITGKMVSRTSANEAFIATLPSGVYVATITATDGTRYAGKFVKQ